MKKKEYLVNNLSELDNIAKELVDTFNGGEVIFCYANLGVGKTSLAKAIGKYLGVISIINSPTFNLIKVYKGIKYNFYHIDCYRLEETKSELKDLGLQEIVHDKNNITFIEWPEYVGEKIEKLPNIIKIYMEYIDENKRKVIIKDERK